MKCRSIEDRTVTKGKRIGKPVRTPCGQPATHTVRISFDGGATWTDHGSRSRWCLKHAERYAATYELAKVEST